MCTMRSGNDQFAPILGYGDLVQGNVMSKRVYYVEGLNHNLFSIGQFYDADLEVAFRKSTCYVTDLKGNDLLTGTRGSDLYIIALQESSSLTPIYFMAKASPTQAWITYVHLVKWVKQREVPSRQKLFQVQKEGLGIHDHINEPSCSKMEIKVRALSDNLQQHDTQPTLNVQPTTELIIPPTNVNAEENNNHQAEDA
ncbi:hypothetical protein Tco_0846998 [Tanacetum coccineum]